MENEEPKTLTEIVLKNEVNIKTLDKRTIYILDITKQHREDIETLFKYVKYVTIYAIVLNLILVGILLCSIITN